MRNKIKNKSIKLNKKKNEIKRRQVKWVLKEVGFISSGRSFQSRSVRVTPPEDRGCGLAHMGSAFCSAAWRQTQTLNLKSNLKINSKSNRKLRIEKLMVFDFCLSGSSIENAGSWTSHDVTETPLNSPHVLWFCFLSCSLQASPSV